MTPPTPITPAMAAQLKEEIERLKAELAKTKPKNLVPLGRIIPSKTHDFEFDVLFYKTDADGKLMEETKIVKDKDGKEKEIKGFIFDPDMRKGIISTVQLRALLEGKANSAMLSTEEDAAP